MLPTLVLLVGVARWEGGFHLIKSHYSVVVSLITG